MSWIDERLQQRREIFLRNTQIEHDSERIFNDIWDAIIPFVEEAALKGINVSTNGTPFERTVSLSVVTETLTRRTASLPKVATIKLEKEKHVITVVGTQPNIELAIDICSDGVVCVKYQGRRVLIGGIAAYILDRFLFPDLAPMTQIFACPASDDKD